MPAAVQHSFRVTGMDCLSCAAKVEAAVCRLAGTSDVKVDVKSQTMTVRLEPGVASLDAVAKAVEDIGYAVQRG